MPLDAFVQGFIVAFSLIAAIGAQNAYVLRQGLRREHVLAVALFCAASDAVLISAGVAGFGILVEKMPQLVTAMRWLGAAFLIVYGALRFHAAWKGGEHLDPGASSVRPLPHVLATLAALTWFNPHVYLDTVVLIGAVSTRWGEAAPVFGLGAATASLVFFLTLAYGARLLAPLFRKPVAWRILDGFVGLLMWSIAWSLLV